MNGYFDPLSLPLRKLYHFVQYQIMLVYFRWKTYLTLYDKDDATLELLQKSASFFFATLQDGLLESIVLAVCRLLEPPVVSRQNTASMQHMVDLVAGVRPEVAKELQNHLAIADANSNSIKDWRNNWSAHTNYGVVLRARNVGFDRREMESVLAELCAFLLEFERAFGDPAFVANGALSADEQLERSNEYDEYRIHAPLPLEIFRFVGDGSELIALLKKAEHSP